MKKAIESRWMKGFQHESMAEICCEPDRPEHLLGPTVLRIDISSYELQGYSNDGHYDHVMMLVDKIIEEHNRMVEELQCRT